MVVLWLRNQWVDGDSICIVFMRYERHRLWGRCDRVIGFEGCVGLIVVLPVAGGAVFSSGK